MTENNDDPKTEICDNISEASEELAAKNAAQQIDEIFLDNKESEEHMIRVVEALLFTTDMPLSVAEIQNRLPISLDAKWILRKLQTLYDGRGVMLCENGGKWAFRSAPDLSPYLARYVKQTKKLSRSAQEILGIIAYHQPVTRTEIESIRGVGVSKGTLDLLIEINWVKLGKRRETPGRPVTFVTTDHFLDHFGLHSVRDLPGLKELKEAGFLDSAGREVTSEELNALLTDKETEEAKAISEAEEAAASALAQEELFENRETEL